MTVNPLHAHHYPKHIGSDLAPSSAKSKSLAREGQQGTLLVRVPEVYARTL